jgi:superfamily II DNA or RNA helicase
VKYRNDKLRNRQSASSGIEFLLLSRDTAKLGMPKVPALIHKARHVIADRTGRPAMQKTMITYDSATGAYLYHVGQVDTVNAVRVLHDVWVCPECNAVQTKTDENSVKKAKERAKDKTDFDLLCELKVGFKDLAYAKSPYLAPNVEGRHVEYPQYRFFAEVQDYHCTSCGANLMRHIDPTRESVSGMRKRRLQPAWFIKKYLKGAIDLLVVDELHQYKTKSGQGEAMGDIVTAAKRVLGLTGTLSDGKASSLYHLLWRIAPGEMLADGIDHQSLNKFTHFYGVLQQTSRYAKDDVRSDGGSTSRKLIANPPKEIPGLSPKLFVNHLADKCVFLELGDIGLPLVELDEKPIFVAMDQDHAMEYAIFHSELEEKMKLSYMLGNKHAFAHFIPSVVNAANQPHLEQEVEIGESIVSFMAPNDPQQLSNKEAKMLADIKEEIAQQRRCVVYVRYSGDMAQDDRIRDVLAQNGVRARMMKSTVSPEDRIDWLAKAMNDDIQVVVLNAKLVEVGLDLLEFPTLMFYQFTDEIATMRQASRRAWRIGQHRRCTIRYYVYEQSYEVVQFKRMLAKRSHAMLLEGRLDRSEVATFIEQDKNSASTFSIAACLGNINDLAQKWQTLADKDIPASVMLLEESRFQTEIHLAMQRLAAETRRLANVAAPISVLTEDHMPRVETVASAIVDWIESTSLVEQLSLFDSFTDGATDVAMNTTDDNVQPLVTVGELRKQMGMVTKATKKSSKTKESDDQLVFLFA